jgi:endonuclease/exonuclease/phosphatase family metal-dependent hydrolase
VVATPLGKVALYVMHPISPRESFYHMRGEGLRREIASGRLFEGAHAHEVQANSGLRRLQVAAVAADAARETLPVLIVGDTNLPVRSQIYGEILSRFADGFAAASWGFGYTYPRKLPWMRLDRILANDRLRFVSFDVGSSRASDHVCVVADVRAVE